MYIQFYFFINYLHDIKYYIFKYLMSDNCINFFIEHNHSIFRQNVVA